MKKEKDKDKKKKLILKISISIIVLLIIISILIFLIMPTIFYNLATKNMNNNDYEKAIKQFSMIEGYKDSKEQIINCYKNIINNILDEENIDVNKLTQIPNKVYNQNKEECYKLAIVLFENKNWETALKYFEICDGYEETSKYIEYIKGITVQDTDEAIRSFEKIADFRDSNNQISDLYLKKVKDENEISINSALENLEKIPIKNEECNQLIEKCNKILKYTGRYNCYQKMKKDGTMSTEDINYYVELSFYLKKGIVYSKFKSSLFHDSSIGDAEVQECSEEGYDFIANFKNNNYTKRTEVVKFSEKEALYFEEGRTNVSNASDVFYYCRK